jgi:hypothetical protein
MRRASIISQLRGPETNSQELYQKFELIDPPSKLLFKSDEDRESTELLPEEGG